MSRDRAPRKAESKRLYPAFVIAILLAGAAGNFLPHALRISSEQAEEGAMAALLPLLLLFLWLTRHD